MINIKSCSVCKTYKIIYLLQCLVCGYVGPDIHFRLWKSTTQLRLWVRAKRYSRNFAVNQRPKKHATYSHNIYEYARCVPYSHHCFGANAFLRCVPKRTPHKYFIYSRVCGGCLSLEIGMPLGWYALRQRNVCEHMCVSRRCVVICGVCDGQSLPKDEEWNGLEIEEWIIRVVIVWCVCAAVGRKAPTPHSNHNHHPTTRYYNSHAVDQNVRLIQIYFELNVLLSHFIHIHILHIRIYTTFVCDSWIYDAQVNLYMVCCVECCLMERNKSPIREMMDLQTVCASIHCADINHDVCHTLCLPLYKAPRSHEMICALFGFWLDNYNATRLIVWDSEDINRGGVWMPERGFLMRQRIWGESAF